MKRSRPLNRDFNSEEPYLRKIRSKTLNTEPDLNYPILKYSNLKIANQDISDYLFSVSSPKNNAAQTLKDKSQPCMCLVPIEYFQRPIYHITSYKSNNCAFPNAMRHNRQIYNLQLSKQADGQETQVSPNQWAMDIEE